MSKKFIGVIAAMLSAVLMLSACQFGDPAQGTDIDAETLKAMKVNPELVKNKVKATIELDDGDEIKLELYPDLAPETVQNFVELAEDGFYDGTIFHRVIKDFMIQGGGYDENLKKQNTNTVKGEFSENGFENTLSHIRGIISMARAQDVNSATSQFFIVQQNADYLDGKYAAFGRVTEGMDVVDKIASVRTGSVAAQGMEDVPVDPIVIRSITIDNGSSSKSDKDSKSDKMTPKPSKKPTASPGTSPSSSPAAGSEIDEDTLRRILGGDDSSSSSSSRSSSSGSSASSSNSANTSDENEPIARGNLNSSRGNGSF